MSSRILIAEDDTRISAFLEKGLRANGFAPTVVTNGRDAHDLAISGEFDLLILDIGLPAVDGFEVLTLLRKRKDRLPVIILTARDSVADTVAGLEGGADDYMSKPFRFEQLMARIRARLREDASTEATTLHRGSLSLDLRTRRAEVDGRSVDLSAREFALAEVFLRHPGHVLSREQLLSRVWGYDFDPGSNVVESTSATCAASSATRPSRRCAGWATGWCESYRDVRGEQRDEDVHDREAHEEHRERVAYDVACLEAEYRQRRQHPERLQQVGARLTEVVDDHHPPGVHSRETIGEFSIQSSGRRGAPSESSPRDPGPSSGRSVIPMSSAVRARSGDGASIQARATATTKTTSVASTAATNGIAPRGDLGTVASHTISRATGRDVATA